MPHDVRRSWLKVKEPALSRSYQQMRFEQIEYNCRDFDRTQSIFVHIPKAAGISVCSALYGSKAAGHATIWEYETIFPRKEFKNYFKFTIVRNPWDRVHSAYKFLKKGGINAKDAAFAETTLSRYADFDDFVLNFLPEGHKTYTHFLPQCDFLRSYSGRELAVDFIGKMESLDRDFEYIKSKVNPVATLEHLNKSDAAPSPYTEQTYKTVAEIYKKDIELLGY
jgi:hypothetical protein